MQSGGAESTGDEATVKFEGAGVFDACWWGAAGVQRSRGRIASAGTAST